MAINHRRERCGARDVRAVSRRQHRSERRALRNGRRGIDGRRTSRLHRRGDEADAVERSVGARWRVSGGYVRHGDVRDARVRQRRRFRGTARNVPFQAARDCGHAARHGGRRSNDVVLQIADYTCAAVARYHALVCSRSRGTIHEQRRAVRHGACSGPTKENCILRSRYTVHGVCAISGRGHRRSPLGINEAAIRHGSPGCRGLVQVCALQLSRQSARGERRYGENEHGRKGGRGRETAPRAACAVAGCRDASPENLAAGDAEVSQR